MATPNTAASATAAPQANNAAAPAAAANQVNAAAGSAAPAAPGFGSTSLYVGDLAPDVNEAVLFETFSAVGQVASIRVCRDSVTRRSLRYAYVNFANAQDAERALDTLNYSTIKGVTCRIMWSQRDPSVRKNGSGNIFIKNLDKSIDSKALYDTFSAFGNILSCKVVLDDQGNSKGFGFVHFETGEAAEQAIAKVNNMQLTDKIVTVGRFIPGKERQLALGESATKFKNVFVKNLADDVTDEQLREKFSEYGPITSAVVMRDHEQKSRGFGFVCFEQYESANKAVEALNGTEVFGKQLFVARAQKKNEREAELKRKFEEQKQERLNQYQGVNLYLKFLDDAIDEDRLRAEFGHCGTITSAKIMRDDKGNSKGFGFVCFSNPEEATKAVTEMNGKMLGQKPIYVALAQRASERRQQLENQYAQRHMRQQNIGGVIPNMYANPYMYGNAMGGAMRPGVMYNPQMGGARPRWQAPLGPMRAAGFNPMYAPPLGGVAGPRGGMRSQRPTGGMRGGLGPQGAPRLGGPQIQTAGRPPRAAYPPKFPGPMARPLGMPLPGGEPLTASALASADPAMQKRMIGERLFPLIHAAHPQEAGKITGMLLEMDNTELLTLLESTEALNAKVMEAIQVLQAHKQASQKDGEAQQ